MIKHFAADGTVKREWPEGLSAQRFLRDGKSIAEIQGSNAILEHVEVAEGEQVGVEFVAPERPAAPAPASQADVDILKGELGELERQVADQRNHPPTPVVNVTVEPGQTEPAPAAFAPTAAFAHPPEVANATVMPIVETPTLTETEIKEQVKWDKAHPTQEEQERAKTEPAGGLPIPQQQ